MTIADLKRGKTIIMHFSQWFLPDAGKSVKKKWESATSVWPNVFSITGSNSKAREGPIIHKSC